METGERWYYQGNTTSVTKEMRVNTGKFYSHFCNFITFSLSISVEGLTTYSNAKSRPDLLILWLSSVVLINCQCNFRLLYFIGVKVEA